MAMTGGTAKLVKTTYPFSDKSKAVNLYVYYKSSQSIADNKSTVTVGMYVTTPSGWDIGVWDDWNAESYVGTTANTFDGTIPNFSGTRWLVENKTFTVTHNDDGTGKATIYWKWAVNSPWGGYVNPSGSFSIDLPTIARATTPTLSATSVQMGKTIKITMNRAASSLTHKLKYTINGVTGDIADDLGTSYTWTVPKALARHIPDLLKATVTITCETYSGDTKIGSKTVSFTVTVPNASVPTLSATSVQMGKSVTITTNREVSFYTHTLKYTLNGTTGTIATGVTASKAWTVPDLVALIPNATSGNAIITCETYHGTVKVGENTVSLGITVYPATTPTFSAESVQMGEAVTITLGRASGKYTHTISYAIGSSSGNIGTQVGASKEWTVPASLIKEIPNATSGTVTVTCVTYNGTAVIGTVKKTLTVTALDASAPSFDSSPVITKRTKLTFNRKTTYYKHDVTVTFGNKTLSLSDIDAAAVDILLPIEFAEEIPDKTSGTGVLVCVTKNGTAIVGSHSFTFTAAVPDNEETKPEFSFTLGAENGSLISRFDGMFIQNKSKLKVTFDAYSGTSTIKSYTVNVQGADYNGNPSTSAVITQSGKVKVTVTVTDARGYSRIKEAEISVIPYSRPYLSPYAGQYSLICRRSSKSGVPKPNGEYVLVQVKGSCSDVVYNGTKWNFCRIKYRYKTEGSSDYTMDWVLLTGTEINSTLADRIFNVKTAYTVQLLVEDDIGEERSYSFSIPYISIPIHEGEGGKNLGLGQYCDYSEEERIDIGWKTYFNTGIGRKVIFEADEGIGWLSGEVLEDKIPDADTTKIPNYTLFLAVLNNGAGVLCARVGNVLYGSLGVGSSTAYNIHISYAQDITTLQSLYSTGGNVSIISLYALL